RGRGARPAAPPRRGDRAAADVADRDEGARPGGHREDPGWAHRPAPPGPGPAEGAPDEPVTRPVVDAMVKVLAAWDWTLRPAGVLTLPSRTRPRLITSLGQQIAGVGRLPYLGALGYADGPGPGPRRHNSAQRLSSL